MTLTQFLDPKNDIYAEKTSKEDLASVIDSDVVIEKAYDALNQFNWSEKELIAYEQELKRIWDNRAVEEYKLLKAEEKGKAEGKAELIKMMLANGASAQSIAQITGLSIAEIIYLNSICL